MLRFIRIAAILATLLGLMRAQEAPNLFEKAPPDVEAALRARITQFYQYFVEGKFRPADALVADDAKDIFFAAEKRKFHRCSVGNISYSDNFTKAKAVVSCDTDYFMMGRQMQVTLPITSLWKIQNGEWFWYTIPVEQQTTYNSPTGPHPMPPMPGPTDPTPSAAITMPDPLTVANRVASGVKVDRDSLDFNSTKTSEQEVRVKNTMPGAVTLHAGSTIDGLKVAPTQVVIGAGEEKVIVISFDPEDPAIKCSECLSHPQDRLAGEVTFHVDPTGQEFAVKVNFVVGRKPSN